MGTEDFVCCDGKTCYGGGYLYYKQNAFPGVIYCCGDATPVAAIQGVVFRCDGKYSCRCKAVWNHKLSGGREHEVLEVNYNAISSIVSP